jgi:prepilin peptidase CpaA
MWLTTIWNMHVECGPLQWGAVIGASLAAAVLDLRSNRIPNWLTLPLWAAGLAHAAIAGSLAGQWPGALAGLGGALAASFILALPFFLLFALFHGGASDAKLMAALGAWLGIVSGLTVLFAVSLCGVLLAVVFALARKRLQILIINLRIAILHLSLFMRNATRSNALVLLKSKQPHQADRMPYGVAILAGVCAAAIWGDKICQSLK